MMDRSDDWASRQLSTVAIVAHCTVPDVMSRAKRLRQGDASLPSHKDLVRRVTVCGKCLSRCW